MTAEILRMLETIETHHGVRILHACESGSRAWGFASPDSDYDIRFIFAKAMTGYLSAGDGAETIELPIEGELDAGGWDVRKAVRLLGKSNGPLIEWLHSPIVYRSEPGFLERWQQAARQVFSPKLCHDHYRGLAKQMVRAKLAGDLVRPKDYLYALRATLAARWVARRETIPPVPFARLVPTAPDGVRDLIPGLMDFKSQNPENTRMARLPELDEFLHHFLADPVDPSRGATDPLLLDRLFRREIRGRIEVPHPGKFTLERIRRKDLLLFDAIAGSHAYGTAIDGSDEDRRGVFVAPRPFVLGLDSIEQVADERSDQVYYEIGHFVSLLLKSNPNALELLAMPDDCILHRHPLFGELRPEMFLSKLCGKTFGEYAMGQIRKARGLNKKIVNPQPEERLPMLHFCHVPEGQGSVPVLDWLAARGIEARHCGLTGIRHTDGVFAIYHEPGSHFRGMVSPKDPDAMVFSSVPREAVPIAWMHFNADSFRAHCKAHREYWEWVRHRNEERYQTNAGHGRGYDSKNLMHTLRLLDMAGEIAREGVLRVRRPNREFLLRVRSGEFGYDELVKRAEDQLEEVKAACAASPLPDQPDRQAANRLLVEIREEFGGSAC